MVPDVTIQSAHLRCMSSSANLRKRFSFPSWCALYYGGVARASVCIRCCTSHPISCTRPGCTFPLAILPNARGTKGFSKMLWMCRGNALTHAVASAANAALRATGQFVVCVW